MSAPGDATVQRVSEKVQRWTDVRDDPKKSPEERTAAGKIVESMTAPDRLGELQRNANPNTTPPAPKPRKDLGGSCSRFLSGD